MWEYAEGVEVTVLVFLWGLFGGVWELLYICGENSINNKKAMEMNGWTKQNEALRGLRAKWMAGEITGREYLKEVLRMLREMLEGGEISGEEYLLTAGEELGAMRENREIGSEESNEKYEELRQETDKWEAERLRVRLDNDEEVRAMREKRDSGEMSARECYEGELRKLKAWLDAGEIRGRYYMIVAFRKSGEMWKAGVISKEEYREAFSERTREKREADGRGTFDKGLERVWEEDEWRDIALVEKPREKRLRGKMERHEYVRKWEEKCGWSRVEIEDGAWVYENGEGEYMNGGEVFTRAEDFNDGTAIVRGWGRYSALLGPMDEEWENIIDTTGKKLIKTDGWGRLKRVEYEGVDEEPVGSWIYEYEVRYHSCLPEESRRLYKVRRDGTYI